MVVELHVDELLQLVLNYNLIHRSLLPREVRAEVECLAPFDCLFLRHLHQQEMLDRNVRVEALEDLELPGRVPCYGVHYLYNLILINMVESLKSILKLGGSN